MLHVWEVDDAEDRHVGTIYAKSIVTAEREPLASIEIESPEAHPFGRFRRRNGRNREQDRRHDRTPFRGALPTHSRECWPSAASCRWMRCRGADGWDCREGENSAVRPTQFSLERRNLRPVYGPFRAAVLGPAFRPGQRRPKRSPQPRLRGFSETGFSRRRYPRLKPSSDNAGKPASPFGRVPPL